ncbi:MAG: glycoside hydrolase, partial [Thermoanaerobaculia bacterium]|nr:glycoside hydrolase [Thermoanaerobaculia bacterium]
MRSLRLAAALFVAAVAAPAAAASPAEPPAGDGAFAPYLAATADGAALTWLEPTAPGDETKAPRAHRVRVARWSAGGWSAPATIVESAAVWANWADTPGIAQAGDGTLVAWWLERNGESTYAYGVRIARSTDGGASWQPLGWLHDDLSPTEHGFVSMVAAGDGVRAFWLDGRATADGRPM